MDTRIHGERLSLTVSSYGAEMRSIVRNGREVLWSGDPQYWSRRSPVLFPFVGALKDGKYRFEGAEYPMGQHGFARDEEFELIGQSGHHLLYELRDNEKTRKLYPFSFCLQIEYVLTGSSVGVRWNVLNTGGCDLPFSIGGHPAFVCPFSPSGDGLYRIRLMREGAPLSELEYHPIVPGGLISSSVRTIPLTDGYLVPDRDLFAGDALVIEDRQCDRVSLCGPEGEYLRVDFQTPLLGIWSPALKDAPFICIEPWCGRADGEDFRGELHEREYGNILSPGGEFSAGYTITIP